jgi:hypothetical protein
MQSTYCAKKLKAFPGSPSLLPSLSVPVSVSVSLSLTKNQATLSQKPNFLYKNTLIHPHLSKGKAKLTSRNKKETFLLSHHLLLFNHHLLMNQK